MAIHGTGKRAVIRRIARDTGYSESSVYKILTNPIGFSRSTVEVVQQIAEQYGLRISGPPVGERPTGEMTRRVLRIAVILPSRPLYFWQEAVLGMEKGRARLEEELGGPIRLQFAYYSYPFGEIECERLLSFSSGDYPDALILFPVEQEACHRFLECVEAGTAPPTVLFNDIQDYMTDGWFATHPHIGFIGPDGYEEGGLAADLIYRCAPTVSRVAVVYSRQDQGARTSDDRIRGVCDRLSALRSSVHIRRVELDPSERIARLRWLAISTPPVARILWTASTSAVASLTLPRPL